MHTTKYYNNSNRHKQYRNKTKKNIVGTIYYEFKNKMQIYYQEQSQDKVLRTDAI